MASLLRHIASALVLVALLAACSGDDGGGTTTQFPASSVPTTLSPTTLPPTTTTALEPTEPDLRAELVEMMAADQEERAAWDQVPEGEPLPPGQDRARTMRLREIIAEHGWPTQSMVGIDGATAAWVIAQHSDLDPDFQVEALALMEPAVEAGEADPVEFAYLTDRVASSQGESQVYGTQIGCVDGAIGPMPPLAEPDRVDELRAEVGLGTLEEYYAEFPPGGCTGG
jgi:hypothetical protein